MGWCCSAGLRRRVLWGGRPGGAGRRGRIPDSVPRHAGRRAVGILSRLALHYTMSKQGGVHGRLRLGVPCGVRLVRNGHHIVKPNMVCGVDSSPVYACRVGCSGSRLRRRLGICVSCCRSSRRVRQGDGPASSGAAHAGHRIQQARRGGSHSVTADEVLRCARSGPEQVAVCQESVRLDQLPDGARKCNIIEWSEPVGAPVLTPAPHGADPHFVEFSAGGIPCASGRPRAPPVFACAVSPHDNVTVPGASVI